MSGGPTVRVLRSSNRDGATYGLSLQTQALLHATLGIVHIRPRVFIAHMSPADRHELDPSLRAPLLQILTGRTEEELCAVGLTVVWEEP